MGDDNKDNSPWVGQALRKARKDKGLTMAQVAQLSGVDTSFIGFIERGERRPPLDLVWKLAELLEVRPEKLLPPGSLSPEEIEALDLLHRIPAEHRAAAISALRLVASLAAPPQTLTK